MRVSRTALVALAVVVSLQPASRAQNLTIGLFERNLEALRQESGIPGISAVIVSDRQPVWARGFGMADLERSLEARPDTPYMVGDLAQVIAATLVLRCIDRNQFEISDRMNRWTSQIPDSSATVGHVLRHTSAGEFRYDVSRFAALTPVIEFYHERRAFHRVLADEILERFAMQDAVPGRDIEDLGLDADDVSRYRGALQRLAVPYRVDVRRQRTRSEYPADGLSAGTGLIASAVDLAKFDAALDTPRLLLTEAAAAAMRQRGGPTVPTGLGWFVQSYNNVTLLWHFGHMPNAFSSLLLKVPEYNLTLILLANSDGLSAPFSLEQGDVTRSLFARAFLRVFVP